jgi:hypothetical protein
MKFTLVILDHVSTLNWLIMKSKFAIFVENSSNTEMKIWHRRRIVCLIEQFPVIQTFEYNSEIDNLGNDVDPSQSWSHSLTFSYGLSQIPFYMGSRRKTKPFEDLNYDECFRENLYSANQKKKKNTEPIGLSSRCSDSSILSKTRCS